MAYRKSKTSYARRSTRGRRVSSRRAGSGYGRRTAGRASRGRSARNVQTVRIELVGAPASPIGAPVPAGGAGSKKKGPVF